MSSGLDELFADQPRTLTVSAAAELLGRDRQTILRWINRGTIPAYRIGKDWHIVTSDLKATMEASAGPYSTRDLPEED